MRKTTVEPKAVSAITREVLEALEPKHTVFELTDGRVIEVPYPMTLDEFMEEVDLQSGCLWSELETEYEPTPEEEAMLLAEFDCPEASDFFEEWSFSPADADKNLAFIREECSFEPSPFDNIEFPDVFDAYGEWA